MTTNQTIGADGARLVREHEVAGARDALRGATYADARLVVASDAYLLRLVPGSGRIVDRLATFPAAGGLAYDGRYLWQRSQRSFQQLDPRTGSVVRSVTPELDDVTGLECLQGELLVLHSGGRRLARIRVEDAPLPTHAIAVMVGEAETGMPLQGLAWVEGALWSSTRGALVRIDPSTCSVLEHLPLPERAEVCDVAADLQGLFWCVDGKSGKVRAYLRPGGSGDERRLRLAQASRSSRIVDVSGKGPPTKLAADSPALAVGATFDRILVAVDFSPDSRRALATALLLGDRLQSEVHVLHLAEQGSNAEFLAGAGAALSYGDIAENARAQVVRFVENVFPGRASGVVIHASVGGDLVGTIERVTREVRATLVVLAGRPGQTPFRTRIERIARHLGDVAVIVLPAHREFRRTAREMRP